MGYYYDWLEGRWDPIDHDRELTRRQRLRIERRKILIEDLITEIEISDDSIIKLYAGLLARTLTATDELLIREYSKRLSEMCPKAEKKKTNTPPGREEAERRRAR
jgi:hypothetical protein